MIARKKRILVVEDDRDIAALVKSRLETNGYDVEVTYNGEDCLDVLGNDAFGADLVVLDVILPKMSGYEVCAKIKSRKSNLIPVVMLTSRNHEIDERLGFLCKADAYIHKPLSREYLLPTIEKLLAHADGSAQNG